VWKRGAQRGAEGKGLTDGKRDTAHVTNGTAGPEGGESGQGQEMTKGAPSQKTKDSGKTVTNRERQKKRWELKGEGKELKGYIETKGIPRNDLGRLEYLRGKGRTQGNGKVRAGLLSLSKTCWCQGNCLYREVLEGEDTLSIENRATKEEENHHGRVSKKTHQNGYTTKET